VSPFTAKFDQVRAGTAVFTALEQQGFQLFKGKALCSHCHAISDNPPLFTNFGFFNIGLPRNPVLPFFNESQPDGWGYVANPDGLNFIDKGLGGFLSSSGNPQWVALAQSITVNGQVINRPFDGSFQTPSLRDTAMAPTKTSFVKTHDHNGFIMSLAMQVHFYNTRDVLGPCGGANTQIGVNCWPPPEFPLTKDTRIGNLGLSPTEEAAIVAFLGTLTDTVFTPPQ
jgi:cytochrome c peroxidase